MKRKNTTLIAILCCFIVTSFTAKAEIEARYQQLATDMQNDEAIVQFIEEDNAFSEQLRHRYLLQLAASDEYERFIEYYQPTQNKRLQCHYLKAHIMVGYKEAALQKVSRFWLSGQKQPSACRALFSLWQQSEYFSHQLLWQRFILAMRANNHGLAKELRGFMDDEDKKIASRWFILSKSPHHLRWIKLPMHHANSALISHALSRWVSKNKDAALNHWQKVQDDYAFSTADKQHFFQQVALYAALRHQADTEYWFKKLNSKLLPDVHQQWRIRAALNQKNWVLVNRLIETLPKNLRETACWQYWHARALMEMGETSKAKAIYKTLSGQRHYYGFLASFHSNTKMNMHHNDYFDDDELIAPYQDEINEINQLYLEKKVSKASRLNYQLMKKLSVDERYQLAREYADWDWHEKALLLSNIEKYKDDLRLRFPLAHLNVVKQTAKKHQLDKSFIYAVIRQESTFRPKVKSRAGALGLMQIIPRTARRMARQYKIPLKHMKQLYQPTTNVRIGTAYLQHLAKRFDSHPVLMAAAYNAGPTQVSDWLTELPKHSCDIWIEALPFKETRNYLKNIVSFYAVYQYRLNKKPNIDAFMQPL